jgi:integrase
MPQKKFTEKEVEGITPPASGQVDYEDETKPRLVLRVNYGGAKVWRVRHYLSRVNKDGKRVAIPTTHKIGRFPTVTVKDAWEKAKKFDPEKEAKASGDTGTVRQVAENFIKRHVEAKGLRSKAEIERCLRKYIYVEAKWEHRPFREIKRSDVADLLDKMVDNHGARQADYVLAILRKMMNWYATRDDLYVVPVAKGMHRSDPSGRKRDRILDDDEIRALWAACEESGTFGGLLKVALLTGQRIGKVVTMKWEDVVEGEWRIPSEKREKGNAGTLRLPQIVLDVIDSQPRILGNPYVFAGSRVRHNPGKDKPAGPPVFNSWSHPKSEIDARIAAHVPNMRPWVIHDLRRSARSLMSRAGVRPDVAERVLGHVIAGVAGVYDRHRY